MVNGVVEIEGETKDAVTDQENNVAEGTLIWSMVDSGAFFQEPV